MREEYAKLTATMKIQNDDTNKEKQKAFLVLSGAFNPIHKMHIEVLEIAKQHLESRNFSVVGGFIVPSREEYVKSKLGDDAMPLNLRIKLIEIVLNKSDWISLVDSGMQGWGTAQRIRDELLEFTGEVFVPFVVMGADVVVKNGYQIYPVIAISRGETENEKIREWIRNREVHEHFIFIEIDNELMHISSSRIRELLNEHLRRDNNNVNNKIEHDGNEGGGDGDDDDDKKDEIRKLKNEIDENVLVYLQNNNINKYERHQ